MEVAAGTRIPDATSTMSGTTGQLLGTHLEENRPNPKFKSLPRLITSKKCTPPKTDPGGHLSGRVAGARVWGHSRTQKPVCFTKGLPDCDSGTFLLVATIEGN